MQILWDQLYVPKIVKSEKIDIIFNPKLSVPIFSTATYICMFLMWLIFDILLRGVNFNKIIVTVLTFAVFGLAAAAIVFGSIDLNRIKRGQYSIKGKGFDITGIVLGSVFILAIIWFALSDAPVFQ